MNLHLHIERLFLDGLPVTRAEGLIVQAALEAELARLLAAEGVRGELLAGSGLPSLAAASFQVEHDVAAPHLGMQIAGAVHRQLSEESRQTPIQPRKMD